MSDKRLKVTLLKSVIGRKETHRASVRGLGLKRLNQSVIVADTQETRGLVNRVNYLVKCEDV